MHSKKEKEEGEFVLKIAGYIAAMLLGILLLICTSIYLGSKERLEKPSENIPEWIK